MIGRRTVPYEVKLAKKSMYSVQVNYTLRKFIPKLPTTTIQGFLNRVDKSLFKSATGRVYVIWTFQVLDKDGPNALEKGSLCRIILDVAQILNTENVRGVLKDLTLQGGEVPGGVAIRALPTNGNERPESGNRSFAHA